MAAGASLLLLLLLGLSSPRSSRSSSAGPGPGPGTDPHSERGRMELRRVRGLAAQPLYGECWARALEHLDARCRDLTAEGQSRVALRFTHCHLRSSGRRFPPCPEGSEVSACTGAMDAAAFHAYTEFFTHTHDICRHLQAEAWQGRAEDAMLRLTESSAGVAEQLQSARLMAEELQEAQSAALQAQQEILSNGEELKDSLRDSAEGLRSVLVELSGASREQQVALAELFNRLSFLQSLLLMEAHGLTSCCCHAAALGASYLLTSTQRSSRARLPLLSLVCLSFFLERRICQSVLSSDRPEHQQTETLAAYLGVLRRAAAALGLCVLLGACLSYRDPLQQSLQLLQQLRETQRSLQEALQRAERLGERRREEQEEELHGGLRNRLKTEACVSSLTFGGNLERRRRSREEEEEEEGSTLTPPTDVSALSSLSACGQDLLRCGGRDDDSSLRRTPGRRRSPGRRPRGSAHLPSPSSPLVYSVLVEDKQPRYRLRSRRSDVH